MEKLRLWYFAAALAGFLIVASRSSAQPKDEATFKEIEKIFVAARKLMSESHAEIRRAMVLEYRSPYYGPSDEQHWKQIVAEMQRAIDRGRQEFARFEKEFKQRCARWKTKDFKSFLVTEAPPGALFDAINAVSQSAGASHAAFSDHVRRIDELNRRFRFDRVQEWTGKYVAPPTNTLDPDHLEKVAEREAWLRKTEQQHAALTKESADGLRKAALRFRQKRSEYTKLIQSLLKIAPKVVALAPPPSNKPYVGRLRKDFADRIRGLSGDADSILWYMSLRKMTGKAITDPLDANLHFLPRQRLDFPDLELDRKPLHFRLTRYLDPFTPMSALVIPRVDSPATPPPAAPATAVVYLKPLPAAIWGSVDLSVDALPEWAPPSAKEDIPGHNLLRQERYVFVYGHRLPSSSAAANFVSEDPKLTYSVVASSPEPFTLGADDRYHTLLRFGWTWAMLRSPVTDDEFFGTLKGLILRVDTKPGTLKGIKNYRLNGLRGAWALTQSYTRVSLMIQRREGGKWDWTDTLFMPERFAVEARTTEDIDLAEIPVLLTRGEQPTTFGKLGSVVPAKKVGPKLYRTDPIETYRENSPPSNIAPGVLYHWFRPGDTLVATVRHTTGFELTDAAEAKVWQTPEQVGAGWKAALRQAAEFAEVPFTGDWASLSHETAKTFVNFSGSDLWILTQEAGNPIVVVWRKARGEPRFADTTKPVRLTEIKVGDHAAMILMRRMFLEMLQEHIQQIKDLNRPEKVLAAQLYITRLLPKDHPLARRVPPVLDNRTYTMHLSRFLVEDQLERTFPDPSERSRVRLAMVRSSLNRYLLDLNNALAHAEGIKETDVAELFKLTGRGFGKIELRLMPRLMTISNNDGSPRRTWAPETLARQHVQGLGYVAQLLRANEKIGEADTQVILGVASIFPVLSGPSLFRTVFCLAMGVADAVDVSMQIQREMADWQEYKFARAARDILDGERASLAVMERPTMIGTVLSVAATLFGFKCDAGDAIKALRVNAKGRIPELAAKIEAAGDLPATEIMRQLPVEEQADILALATTIIHKHQAGMGLEPAETVILNLGSKLKAESATIDLANRPLKTADGVTLDVGSSYLGRPKGAVVKPEEIPEGLPSEKALLSTPDGKGVQLDGAISTNTAFCGVYLIRGEAKVAKVAVQAADKNPRETIERTLRGHRKLRNTGIPHPAIDEADIFLDAERPFFKQELLDFKADPDNLKMITKPGKLEPEFQHAVLRMFKKLIQKKLIWYDCHLKNIYFKKINGQWEAGILDSDFLHHIIEPPAFDQLAGHLYMIEHWPAKWHIHSMAGAPKPPRPDYDPNALRDLGERIYGRDADLFMEKMLEHKQWIQLESVGADGTGVWTGMKLDIDIVKDYFPNLDRNIQRDLRTPPTGAWLKPLRQLLGQWWGVPIPLPQPVRMGLQPG